jgi:hypothetical protein
VQKGTCTDDNNGMTVLGFKPLSLTCIMILFVNHKSTNPKISQFLLRLPQLHQVRQRILLWHALAPNPHQWNLQLLGKCIKSISQSIHKSKVVVVTFHNYLLQIEHTFSWFLQAMLNYDPSIVVFFNGEMNLEFPANHQSMESRWLHNE